MKKEQVFNRVREIVSYLTHTDPATINGKTNLYGDLAVDSLDFIEISMEIEKEFKIELPDNLSEINYIDNIVDAVMEQLNKKDAVLHKEKEENAIAENR